MKESNESFHDFMYECAYAYISHVRTLLYTFNCVEAVVFGSWADFQAINVEVYKVFTHTKMATILYLRVSSKYTINTPRQHNNNKRYGNHD